MLHPRAVLTGGCSASRGTRTTSAWRTGRRNGSSPESGPPPPRRTSMCASSTCGRSPTPRSSPSASAKATCSWPAMPPTASHPGRYRQQHRDPRRVRPGLAAGGRRTDWAGEDLLDTYEAERRPVAPHNLTRSTDPNGRPRPSTSSPSTSAAVLAHVWVTSRSAGDLLGPGLTLFRAPGAPMPASPVGDAPVADQELESACRARARHRRGRRLLARPGRRPRSLRLRRWPGLAPGSRRDDQRFLTRNRSGHCLARRPRRCAEPRVSR